MEYITKSKLIKKCFNSFCILNEISFIINLQIVCSVSDSGANFVCALNKFIFPNYPCGAHKLNLCVNDILKVCFGNFFKVHLFNREIIR